MNAVDILYTVTTAAPDSPTVLSFIGDSAFMDSVGFGWDIDEALQNMDVASVTDHGVCIVEDWGMTYETRSHWLLQMAQCN